MSTGNEQVQQICDNYKKIYKYFPTVKLVFLEILFYSVFLWNLSTGHPQPEEFRETDKILEGQVSQVNKFIRETNLLLRGNSPNFGLDFQRVRKHANCAPVYSNNYGLYIDGIHPHPDLARLWLIRIMTRIVEDCKNTNLL